MFQPVVEEPSSVLPALPPPLFEVNVTEEWGPGYAVFIEDVLRMICIQLTIQIMLFYSSDSPNPSFLTPQFVIMIAYVVLGVALYWLVLKRVVVFK